MVYNYFNESGYFTVFIMQVYYIYLLLIMNIEHNLKNNTYNVLNKYLTWIISKKLSIDWKGCSFVVKILG